MGAKDEELGGIFQLEKVGPAGTLWTVNYNVKKNIFKNSENFKV